MTKPINRSNFALLLEIYNDPERKPLFRLIYEFSYLLITQREFPLHYFSRYLFKKGKPNIKDYLPNKFLGKIPSQFNDQKVKQVLDNKLYFNLFYGQFNISLPEILMYNHKNLYIINNKSIVVNTIYEFTDLLEDLFKQNASINSIIIKKTYASSSGREIFRLSQSQVRADPAKINAIFSEVSTSEFLFQATIKQHPDLERLNSSCLNTMRIDTFINPDGNIDIISAYIRVSIYNNYIDNVSSGGCMVGVNLKTGKLKKYGYAPIQAIGVKVLTEHPVTGIVFENFTIPFFDQVKALVLKTASLMPQLRLIGWDVGIGESGPVLIEGNSDYDISGCDLGDDGYFTNATFRKVLKELNYL